MIYMDTTSLYLIRVCERLDEKTAGIDKKGENLDYDLSNLQYNRVFSLTWSASMQIYWKAFA